MDGSAPTSTPNGARTSTSAPPEKIDAMRQQWSQLEIPDSLGAAKAYVEKMHEWPLDYYEARVDALGLKGERLLDAGCGTGTWAFAFARHFDEVHGVDRNAPRIDAANWLNEQFQLNNVHFTVGDALDLDFPDDHFDTIFCYGVVISYIPLSVALREFHRVLRPGGKMYICLNGVGWSKYLRDERSKEDEKYREMGVRGLYNTICQHGLQPAREALLAARLLREKSDSVSLVMDRASKVTFIEADAFLSALDEVEHFADGRVPLLGGGKASPTAEGAFEFLRTIDQLTESMNCDAMGEQVGRAIVAECGEAYLLQVAEDVLQVARGKQADFSHSNAGRGYEPDEVEAVCWECGFTGFRWAEDGKLGKYEVPVAEMFPGEFGGNLCVWEFEATKVANGSVRQRAKPANRQPTTLLTHPGKPTNRAVAAAPSKPRLRLTSTLRHLARSWFGRVIDALKYRLAILKARVKPKLRPAYVRARHVATAIWYRLLDTVCIWLPSRMVARGLPGPLKHRSANLSANRQMLARRDKQLAVLRKKCEKLQATTGDLRENILLLKEQIHDLRGSETGPPQGSTVESAPVTTSRISSVPAAPAEPPQAVELTEGWQARWDRSAGRRILLYALKDYSGSFFKWAQAINRFTPYAARLVALGEHQYGYNVDLILSSDAKGRERLGQLAEEADCIHIKDETGFLTGSNGLPKDFFRGFGKPLIFTQYGGYARKHKDDPAYVKFVLDSFDARISMTPDLCFPWFRGEFIPHSVDTEAINYGWVDGPVVAHSPSTPARKGTVQFLAAVQMLQGKIDIHADLIHGVSHQACIERKSKCNLFFDQAGRERSQKLGISDVIGWYGNSALEAAALGIPTMAHLSETAFEGAHRAGVDLRRRCAIINVPRDAEGIARELRKYFEMTPHERLHLSVETRQWIQEFHSNRAVAERLADVYGRLLSQSEQVAPPKAVA